MGEDQPVITINGPGHDGTRWPVPEGITSFGRLPSNDIVLVDDLVSRYHARITFFKGRAQFQDLGSQNGSFVNGQPVDGAHTLSGGDLCRIGPFQILFRETTSGPARPSTHAEANPSSPGPDRAVASPVVPPASSSLLAQIEAARSQTQGQSQALQVLLRATEALASAAEVGDYLGRMLGLALEQTQADRGAYVQRSPCGLQVVKTAGPDGPATDARVVPPVALWAIEKNYPIRVEDLAHDLRFTGPPQSVLCVPVPFGDDVLGAIYMARARPAFVSESLDTLVAIAYLTGLGIQASRARRAAVRAKLTRDALERTFDARTAASLANTRYADIQVRQVTLLMVTARGWSTNGAMAPVRARLGRMLDTFCDRVVEQKGRWQIGPGPTLIALFDDDAGPSRALRVVDELPKTDPASPDLRAAITRGPVMIGVAEGEQRRFAALAGPGLEEAETLVSQVPAGQVWLTETAVRLYPGPVQATSSGAYLPT